MKKVILIALLGLMAAPVELSAITTRTKRGRLIDRLTGRKPSARTRASRAAGDALDGASNLLHDATGGALGGTRTHRAAGRVSDEINRITGGRAGTASARTRASRALDGASNTLHDLSGGRVGGTATHRAQHQVRRALGDAAASASALLGSALTGFSAFCRRIELMIKDGVQWMTIDEKIEQKIKAAGSNPQELGKALAEIQEVIQTIQSDPSLTEHVSGRYEQGSLSTTSRFTINKETLDKLKQLERKLTREVGDAQLRHAIRTEAATSHATVATHDQEDRDAQAEADRGKLLTAQQQRRNARRIETNRLRRKHHLKGLEDVPDAPGGGGSGVPDAVRGRAGDRRIGADRTTVDPNSDDGGDMAE